MTIEYDGTGFAGFQVQDGKRTVQGVVESALADLCGAPVRIQGAGRTDAGVHARGQVVAFDSPLELEPGKFAPALNARLPEDLAVLESGAAEPDFHPRFQALGKTYSYRIMVRCARPALERNRVFWRRRPVSAQRLAAVLERFRGTRDFGAFQAAGGSVTHTVRTIWGLQATEPGPGAVEIRFTGDGFLYKMIRNLVGCALWVHDGLADEDWLDEMLETGQRRGPVYCAPAEGLTLESVFYEKADIDKGENDVDENLQGQAQGS